MRLLVMFDLPMETQEDKRIYRQFRTMLIRNGFIMMQESVYTRMLPSPSVRESVCALLRKNKPPKGLVQVLVLTEKQFAQMECIVGEFRSDVLDSTETVVYY